MLTARRADPPLPHRQLASGLRRQPELCQQAAGVVIRMAVQSPLRSTSPVIPFAALTRS